MPLSLGQQLAQYRIEGLLGQGGMAAVYLARHTQLHSLHAIKVLTVTSPRIQQRLVQEGRVQSGLRHPNIVSVTDLLDVGGSSGLVLEFVHGPDLGVWLSHRRCSIDQVDVLARGILAGVASAHQQGFVHRDLKPGNVLLQVADAELIPKVTDFGLAKVLQAEGGAELTLGGSSMGTPTFMAPEQIRDASAVTAAADVFSLGAILFELLTGARAFDGADTMAIFEAVCAGTVDFDQLPPDTPKRMRRAITAALAMDAEERPPDAEALRAIWTGSDRGERATAPQEVRTPAECALARSLVRDVPSEADDAATSNPDTYAFSGLAEPASASTLAPEPDAPGPTVDMRLPASPSAPSSAPSHGLGPLAIFVLGTLGFVPFLGGLLTSFVGSPAELLTAGPWVPLMAGMTLLGMGLVAWMGHRLSEGKGRWMWVWVLPATLVAVVGNGFLGLGCQRVLSVVSTVGVVEAAQMAPRGFEVALGPELVAMVCCASLCLGVCTVATVTLRARLRVGEAWWSPRSTTVLVSAVAVGSVLWMVDLWAFQASTGPTVVFLTLMWVGLMAAFATPTVPDGKDDATVARILLALNGPLGVAAACKLFIAQRAHVQYEAFRDADLVTRLDLAEGLVTQLEYANWVSLGLWCLAGLALASAPLVVARASLKALPRGVAQAVGLVLCAALLLGTRALALNERTELSGQVVPRLFTAAGVQLLDTHLADPIVERFQGMPAVVSGDALLADRARIVVLQTQQATLQPDDRIVAIEGRAVSSIPALARTLVACHCDAPEPEGACAFERCVRGGAPVQLTVERNQQHRPVTVRLPATVDGLVE